MATFTDRFGASVTGDPDKGWKRGGTTLGPRSQEAAKGTFDGSTPENYVPPVQGAIVPLSCTNFQARATLLTMPTIGAKPGGRTLFNDVDDMMKAAGGVAYQAWQFKGDFNRNGRLVASTAATLGMSSAAVDAFFIAAVQATA